MTGTDGERKSRYGSIKFIFILMDLKKRQIILKLAALK